MTINLLWQWQIKRHQNTWPNDGMEPDNFLSYQMNIGRPELIEFFLIIQKANWRQIVGQGIKPYINNMLLINRHRNAPIKGSTGNTQVIQPLLDEVYHFIATRYRLNEVRVILNVFQNTVSIFGHLEEISFFSNFLYRTTTIRTTTILIQLQLCPETFTRRAIKSLIGPLVNIPLVINPAENLLHYLLMTLLGGTEKIVIGNIQHIP